MRFLTPEVPGCGGAWKVTPEDFEVEEIPAYRPSGEGEHLYLWVEKRGLTTLEAAQRLAVCAGCKPDDVGFAGLKDKFAVTRQFFSLPVPRTEPTLDDIGPDLAILSRSRHGNKLRTGHLHGNRFRLWLRGVKDLSAAQAAFAALCAQGLPNAYGDQRFGRFGDNVARGREVLQGTLRVRRFERKLLLSAVQSDLFNRVLARRLEEGTWNRACPGDVLKKHESGGEFVCSEPETDAPRVAAWEVSPTGPMFGPEMRRPEAAVAELEEAVLAESGLSRDVFRDGGGETAGARRWLRVPLGAASLESEGEDVRLCFELPKGSYATGVVRELLKS